MFEGTHKGDQYVECVFNHVFMFLCRCSSGSCVRPGHIIM